MNVNVTTARKRADKLEAPAKQVADDLQMPFRQRQDRSVEQLLAEWETDLLVVGSNRLSLYRQGQNVPFFYHPNAAQVRAKAYLKNGYDTFIETAALKTGESVLDCTLGLAADALMAKLAVGPSGRVTGVEANPIMAYIVKTGLRSWQDAHPSLLSAMRTIEVMTGHHFHLLKSLPDNSFDVVYFDPMFEVTIHASIGIQALKPFAHYEPLSQEIVQEALRVAKRRVVLKDHWQSSRFSELGFQVRKRRVAEFQYGMIDNETEVK
ncbi:class I SAM-dependent methyltransferase [Alkalicoccobacillus plakortidis]|uniref:Class I SAM-dependent methyltransferase n=1 Tax=Alkalicoccobacillus plakortidis TaxID=444060 RepID=A0ABT0XFJ3_9BACI|nr:class I SAM-dependent methyltransferase [Alkalicoccobacillus plakortidis]MCM2674662.1 class I SAM-dependent methyltransferase [Alkalicoccobacillus plakortidis]